MKHLEQFTSTLKDHGYSITESRKTLFLAMLDKEPMLIGAIVKKVGDTMDRSSVYRCLELFEKLGIVHRMQRGFKHLFELTDLFSDHHHHIRCVSCGSLQAIEASSIIEDEITSIIQQKGYKTTSHLLEIEGICPLCLDKQN